MTTYAIITGASAGLGTEFARQLAVRRPDLSLVLVARRVERLKALADELTGAGMPNSREVVVFQCDLSRPDERQRLISWVQEGQRTVSLLINNAGFGTVGDFPEEDPARQVQMVDLNCSAPLHLTAALLPNLSGQGKQKAAIVNVASTASFQPLPYMATYAATKAFLRSLSLALSVELKPRGIQVLALCPGPTRTEFHIAAGLPEKIDNIPAASAEDVIRQTLDRLDGHSRLFIPGLLNRTLAVIAGLTPRPLVLWLAERTLRRYRR